MKRWSHRNSLGVLVAAAAVMIGTVAARVPTLEAAEVVLPGVFTRTTHTNTDPDKKVFANCPTGATATGGGAQVFIPGLDKLPPGQMGRVSIVQVIPAEDMHGYAARAQADAGFRSPWNLKAYVICH